MSTSPSPASDRRDSDAQPPARLLDEHSTPDFRDVFTSLARRSVRIDAAVAAIRLTGLDLSQADLRPAERIRLVLSRVDAPVLRAEAEAILTDPARARTLRHLVHRLQADRLQIRSAPLAGWTPDFTVFQRSGGPWAVLIGLHWFARPYPHRGPALASVHRRESARLAARRFEELWSRAHDVGPAVLNLLRVADERGSGPAQTSPAAAPEPPRSRLRPPTP